VEGMTPAYLNALLSVLHLGGTFQFVGGSLQLAEALKKMIESAGGRVVANAEVASIKVEDHQVINVMTKDGTAYQADSYISDVHPDVLLRLIDDGAFPTAFKKRVAEIPETTSSFKVFIRFKDQAFPYLNYANFYLENYQNTSSLQTNPWPQSLMYITPPVEHQGDFAQTMVIITEMSFDQVRPWEDTHTGHRGETYENWKLSMIDKVLDHMEKLYPNFRSCIDFIFASSPLTIRDFYGNKEGSNYGFLKDSHNLMLSQMSVTTKVRNLFLTGQNVNIHGLCGVTLTAIETVEALVGHNVVIRKINKFWSSHS